MSHQAQDSPTHGSPHLAPNNYYTTQTAGTSISETDTVVGDLETQRQILHSSNPRGESNVGQHGVDVAAAERDFAELSRQLSGLSRIQSRTGGVERVLSRKGDDAIDAEKKVGFEGEGEGDTEGFDLEQHLRGTEASEREAGIRAKKIGRIPSFLDCV